MDYDEKINKAHKMALDTMGRAYAPYSQFYVGACAITDSGKMYSGCNVENASYGATKCAEQVAVTKAISEGEKKITDIVVVVDQDSEVPPCGLCLQVLSEFMDHSGNIWFGNKKQILKKLELKELLPISFDKSYL